MKSAAAMGAILVVARRGVIVASLAVLGNTAGRISFGRGCSGTGVICSGGAGTDGCGRDEDDHQKRLEEDAEAPTHEFSFDKGARHDRRALPEQSIAF
jgi:hypothetical protein